MLLLSKCNTGLNISRIIKYFYSPFIALEWDAPAKSQIIADDRDFIEEHSSVKQVAKCPEEATSVSLQECFR